MRMRCGVAIAAAMLALATAARGDEAADWAAAAGDEAKAYGDCGANYSIATAKSHPGEAASEIADEAITQCSDKAGAIKVALMTKLNISESAASDAVNTISKNLRQHLIEGINQERGQ